ncbi:DNA replication protein DnaD [Heyndrickxia sporothermodurans]|uniref:DNA replication protein DnaD n=2 Tax=Heyndrickxia sporothermodurans TaxID=46224 RepID=A0AB37H6P6_9BACI|nr:DNA replication protein DnaD [Heyndrickxia sporothermodurans]MBL5770594.1 DNA replication protein DnaD [Heyndrickxia sporothermodurans]MBL5774564.1 DNA replication protein DnaD [Heyndrickxia sporothermodurans]MBL5781141.1 DNA replication protein DnaD [Heyndrickxia sporothermodurans]MBL5784871.1 DNA replication protein DnaD [Heyndrickxia sporothermodurans]MBL5788456.1 DNA replication protein DnaD [Heyndrickxia sporothermodurans]
MAKYRMVGTDFWKNPIVIEEMIPEEKYFHLYLLTNPHTTQIGIYRITKKQMAFDLGYSIESVQSLMERFEKHHQLIRYNPETRELAIKNRGRENIQKVGKPVIDCIVSELKEVEDHSLIQYVSEFIYREDIRSMYEAFYHQKVMLMETVEKEDDEKVPCEEIGDTLRFHYTIGGQKEKEKQKHHKDLYPSIENNPHIANPSLSIPKNDDVKEIMGFWDTNRFGFSNLVAKERLLSWLNASSFLQPKEMVIAMKIAYAKALVRIFETSWELQHHYRNDP